ncbi:MAG: S-methyl-5-thioribose-1-phosphate isomerase [Deltaproteobacteria bacterium]|nr:S-methyl-5-thioribose-1-phosphate isomerase [Deltaproteobacteria bacterium]
MNFIKTIEWKNDTVLLLDQRRLPAEEVYITCEDYEGLARAIETMAVREAPTLSAAAAFGAALGAMGISAKNFDIFFEKFSGVCNRLARTRPTAATLFWALEKMRQCALTNRERSVPAIIQSLKEEALNIYDDFLESRRLIGEYGHPLLNDGDGVLTHCNASVAVGVIQAANEAGKRIHVYADETRPRLQGAKITAWELQKYGIQVTVITDTMTGSLMRLGKIQKCVVGADRVAANGDVANKIGTYGVALMAHYHKIPFYVACPTSTIDPATKEGSQIAIEERDPREVTHIGPVQVTPDHVEIINPAFDITPAQFVTGIITEKGLAKPPLEKNIRQFLVC